MRRSLFHLRNVARRAGEALWSGFARVFTLIARGLMHGLRRLDPDRSSDLCGRGARRIGPWLPVSRTGRANLRAAYPEKSAAEIEEILAGVWENLGRVVGEFANLDRLWDWDPLRPDQGRIVSPHPDRFFEVRDDGKPSLIFAAHLANWELAAVGAAAHGADAALLFRIPGSRFAAEIVQEVRNANMGRLVPSSRTAVFELAREIERGAHVGMLVDQFRTADRWSLSSAANARPIQRLPGSHGSTNAKCAAFASCAFLETGFEPKSPSRSTCRATMREKSTSMRACR